MEAILEQKKNSLFEICRKYHVLRLDVFGSAAVDQSGPGSDLDFLVEFDEQADPDRFNIFFDLHRALELLFNRPIDLVEPGGLKNPYFIRRVNETRKQLYVAP